MLSHGGNPTNENTPVLQGFAASCEGTQSEELPDQDSNPRKGIGKKTSRTKNGAESGAVGARDTLVDPGLERLAELWPMLSPDDQAALLAHAEHLAGLRNDANHSS